MHKLSQMELQNKVSLRLPPKHSKKNPPNKQVVHMNEILSKNY